MTQHVDTLVILGGTGDLAHRLLMPALGQLLTLQADRRLSLVGASVEDWSDDEWRERVRDAFSHSGASGASGEAVDALLASTRYRRTDLTDPDDVDGLLRSVDGTPALYFAVPPSIAAKACEALSKVRLPAGIQLALEKPFGTDLASAEALDALLARMVDEDQVHRVDHFLGRSTVFNILGLRFANRVFEPVWSSEHVESIEIVYDEQLALEGRAGYYDHAGALVDMLQSHLLQVMATLMMEPPATLSARDVRDAKAAILRATRVAGGDPVAHSRRARYTAGTVEGHAVPDYVSEQGVDPSNGTETLAEVEVEVDTWRWCGVPVTLRSGKALGERRREMVIRFRPAKRIPTGLKGETDPTVLRILIAPDRMSLELNVNGPDDPYTLDRAELSAEFGPGELVAYAEVLSGVLDADPTLSVRGDTAEQCWRIMGPVLDAWHAGDVPLDEYAAGSSGPESWTDVG